MKTPYSVTIVEAALSYAQNGWPVFPLSGKIPYKLLTPGRESHGHKDATTDAKQIQTWWSVHPKANIGMPTGSVSGLFILDMDVPEGYYNLAQLQKKYGRLPETRRARTANGGLHYYYQYPRNGKRYPGAVGLSGLIGVDVRSEGNYVVLPPSRLYGRLYYQWSQPEQEVSKAPEWLLTLLTQYGEQRHVSQQGLGVASTSGEKWLNEAIGKAREGNRNTIGFWLARMLRNDGVSKQEALRIVLSYANRVPQGERAAYTSQEAYASVVSAYSKPAQERPKRI